MGKRHILNSWMIERHKGEPITYEASLTDWSVRYILMCDYLDEIDEGNLANLQNLIALCNIEGGDKNSFIDGWCSFDHRLLGFEVDNQKYGYDSEGCSYETQKDVFAKVTMLKKYLENLAKEADKNE